MRTISYRLCRSIEAPFSFFLHVPIIVIIGRLIAATQVFFWLSHGVFNFCLILGTFRSLDRRVELKMKEF